MTKDKTEKEPEDFSEAQVQENQAAPKNQEEPLKVKFPFPEKGGRACIIYGRDQILNRQVVSVIKEIGISPAVMPVQGEQAKSTSVFLAGHPKVSFAIIILSADDWVYPKDGKPGEAKMYTDQRVAFHLGFWVGHLGRSRVFALYYDQGSFRWPTEHFDVIYTPLDKLSLWKKELEERLKAAGIPFRY